MKGKHLFLPALFLLMFAGCAQKESDVTFSENIASIVHTNCVPCHRPGGGAPFSLITYKDVRSKARTIEWVVKDGYMPPWPADKNYRHFIGEKGLTENEKQLFFDWVKQGAHAGDTSKVPKRQLFPKGSKIGKPDLVLRSKKIQIKGNNSDLFLVAKIPFELPQDTFIRAIEVFPQNRKLLHHLDAQIISFDEGKKADIYSGKHTVPIDSASTYDELFKNMKVLHDDGSYPTLTPAVTHYLPGVENTVYRAGIGSFSVKKKGVVLLNQLHYGPSPIDTTDRIVLNVFFDSIPPKRPVLELVMGSGGSTKVQPPLIIPAGAKKKFRTQTTLTKDISVLTVAPHMHLIGKSFLAFAVTPKNDTIPLIKIDNWNFRWQYFYTLPNPIKLPSGTTIIAEGRFDNTAKNGNNPFSPPKTISGLAGSMKTTDEMFQLTLSYMLYENEDEKIRLN